MKKILSLADFLIYNETTSNKVQISRGVIKTVKPIRRLRTPAKFLKTP
jgi:hypothetical protein